jgi:hypothetical protein
MKCLARKPFRLLTIGWLVLGISGCGESTESSEDPLLDRGTVKNAASPGSLPQEPPVEGALIREIAEVWSATGRTCGLDRSDPPSPDEVMRSVDPKDRAAAIIRVLETHQLETYRVGRLLELLGATAGDGDEDTAKFISKVFDQAREITTRILSDQLAEYDPEDPDDEGFDVYFENTVARVRVRALQSIAVVPGPLSLAVLERELGSADARLRQSAAIALAHRKDYSDRTRLEKVTQQLHPGMRPAVQAALDSSVAPEDQ